MRPHGSGESAYHLLHVIFLKQKWKHELLFPLGTDLPSPAPEDVSAHNHVHNGVDGLGDDLFCIVALPPVSRCEVAPVRVVCGNDA